MNPTQTKKLVIVEDSQDLAEIYKTRMEQLGFTCYVANDGVAALQLIEAHKPDLVLLDLMVPKIAGDQILERLRSSDWGKDIKVLIISNLNEADAPAGLRGLGIEGYVVKANISNDQLDQMVKSILNTPVLVPSQPDSTQPATAPETNAKPAAPNDQNSPMPPTEPPQPPDQQATVSSF